MNHHRIFGDCRDSLASLEAGSVQCCITSPPYWGLRSYLPVDHPLKAREIGAEKTPEEFVAALVDVFRGVRRALRDDGVLWLNLGDTYAMGTRGAGGRGKSKAYPGSDLPDRSWQVPDGAKPKDLLLIPYRVAMALQADGWYLRASIPWVKANVMPASVTDRPTVAHESIFLLTKSARYFYDVDAVRMVSICDRNYPSREERKATGSPMRRGDPGVSGDVTRGAGIGCNPAGRNRRTSDWWNESIALAIEELQAAQAGGLFHDADGAPLGLNVNTKPYPGAHFAVFPPKLAEPCVKAGSRPGDTILDPFGGSGTTAQVAEKLGRDSIVCELDERCDALMDDRLGKQLSIAGAA